MSEPISEPGLEGVIFSAAALERRPAAQGLLAPAEGFWTPQRDQILDLEARLGPFLEQAAGPAGIAPRLGEYRRQYAGIVRGGRQLVYINAFCRDLGIDWRQEFVMVDDGGACFFSLTYDPQIGAFADLIVNGDA